MWAQIVNGVVYETTTTDPTGRFHESFQWAACPPEVQQGYLYNGEGVFTEPAKPVLTPAQQLAEAAAALLASGLTVKSTGTPAIDGVFPCDPATIAKVSSVQLYVATTGKFPSGDATFWLKTGQTGVTFPNPAAFTTFAEAYAAFVAACEECIDGAPSASLPSASVTVA